MLKVRVPAQRTNVGAEVAQGQTKARKVIFFSRFAQAVTDDKFKKHPILFL
jgi:hypothetical protein